MNGWMDATMVDKEERNLSFLWHDFATCSNLTSLMPSLSLWWFHSNCNLYFIFLSEYDQWKASISDSIIESPLAPRRPLPAQSSLETDQVPSPRHLLKISGDSFEQEDVFIKNENQGEDSTPRDLHRLHLPLNPSPRVSYYINCFAGYVTFVTQPIPPGVPYCMNYFSLNPSPRVCYYINCFAG